jgi:general secretion pathway protein D
MAGADCWSSPLLPVTTRWVKHAARAGRRAAAGGREYRANACCRRRRARAAPSRRCRRAGSARARSSRLSCAATNRRVSGVAPKRRRRGGAPADVTLNFSGADIRDVINAVLGETLKLNYVIDPEVSGRSPSTSAGRSRATRCCRRWRRCSTAAARRWCNPTASSGSCRCARTARPTRRRRSVPDRRRRPSGTAHRSLSAALRRRERHAARARKSVPAGQPIAADDKHHLVLIQGTPSELQLAEDTVRVFDIDQLSGMSIALVPLRNAEPAAIVDELRNIFAATRKEADSDAIRFMAVARLNAVMVITRSGRYLDEARTWIARLDRVQDLTERRVYVYNLQYAKAVQIGEKLQGLLTGLDIQFKAPTRPGGYGSRADGARVRGPGQTCSGAAGIRPSRPPRPRSAPRHAGSRCRAAANTAARNRRAHRGRRSPQRLADLGQCPRLRADPPGPRRHRRAAAAGADRGYRRRGRAQRQPQLRRRVFHQFGQDQHAADDQQHRGDRPGVPGFNLSWVAGNFAPKAILDMLSDVTQTKVISTPRLLVLSNETARLQVGDVVPIITQSATSTVTSNPLDPQQRHLQGNRRRARGDAAGQFRRLRDDGRQPVGQQRRQHDDLADRFADFPAAPAQQHGQRQDRRDDPARAASSNRPTAATRRASRSSTICRGSGRCSAATPIRPGAPS